VLFNYTYISHDIEKLQGFLDFLFLDVWLYADGTFDANKLKGNKELYDIYLELDKVDFDPANAKKNEKGKSAYFFNSSIEKIFKAFAAINDDKFKEELFECYINNNNIESICKNPSLPVLTYEDLKLQQEDLHNELKAFYSKLYGNESPFNLKDFGSLKTLILPTHYQEFFSSNKKGKCPFCGIRDLKGIHHTKKEAYDHYIPKGNYPFNSINFKNLAPMCNDCNSSYKGTKSIIGTTANRNKAFYPYASSHPAITDFTIRIDLKSTDILNLEPKDLDLEIKSNGYDEEIKAWKEVFGIDERYKALLCNESEGITWFTSIVDGYITAKALGSTLTKEQYLESQIIDAKHVPLSSYGFIKSVFLEECESMGLF
jgi:5-methylcytosine-specific restriction endonuclease McrA